MSEERFVIDVSGGFTLGEMEDVEVHTGQAWSEVFPETAEGEERRLSARQLLCFAYIAGKRRDPAFTWDEARGLKTTQLGQGEAPKEEDPPASGD